MGLRGGEVHGVVCIRWPTRLTGDGPGPVVDEVVMVPAETDQVGHDGGATISREDDVVRFVDAGVAVREATLLIA